MGLDSTLYLENMDTLERVYNALVDEKDFLEVLYWRKNHSLFDWFKDNCFIVENCHYHEVTERHFERWLEALQNKTLDYNRGEEEYPEEIERDIKKIKEILKTTDFTKTKFHYYNWW